MLCVCAWHTATKPCCTLGHGIYALQSTGGQARRISISSIERSIRGWALDLNRLDLNRLDLNRLDLKHHLATTLDRRRGLKGRGQVSRVNSTGR